MAKSLFKLGDNGKVGVYGPADVYGGAGDDQVLLFGEAREVSIKGGVERIDVAGDSSAYTYMANAGTLYIMLGTTVVSTITLDEKAPSTVAFTNGSVEVSLAEGGAVQMGDQLVEAGAEAVEFEATVDPEGKSEFSEDDTYATQEISLEKAVATLAAGDSLNDIYILSDTDAGRITVAEFDLIDQAIKGAQNAESLANETVNYVLADSYANLQNATAAVYNGTDTHILVDSFATAMKIDTGIYDNVELTGEKSDDYLVVASSAAAKGVLNYTLDHEWYTEKVSLLGGGNGADYISVQTEGVTAIFAGSVTERDEKKGIYDESQDSISSSTPGWSKYFFDRWDNDSDNTATAATYNDMTGAAKAVYDAAKGGNLLDVHGNNTIMVASTAKDTFLVQYNPKNSGHGEHETPGTALEIHNFRVGVDKIIAHSNEHEKNTITDNENLSQWVSLQADNGNVNITIDWHTAGVSTSSLSTSITLKGVQDISLDVADYFA